jgi:uncharacterized protein YdeI (YjbR/CyaY-like superfamily)
MAGLDVPADIAHALATDKVAQSAFRQLAPGHAREYLRWVADAKKDATRSRRIAGMIQRLKETRTGRGDG